MAARKVFFKLEPDDDGYPPVSVESLWAQENQDGTCVIDNIPFYTREATLGDVVDVLYDEGVAYYRDSPALRELSCAGCPFRRT